MRERDQTDSEEVRSAPTANDQGREARDRLEAESRKYVSPIVLPLESGRFAVFTPDRRLVTITDEADLGPWLRSIDCSRFVAKPKGAAPLDLDEIMKELF